MSYLYMTKNITTKIYQITTSAEYSILIHNEYFFFNKKKKSNVAVDLLPKNLIAG